MNPVTCPKCDKSYIDIGSFIDHMAEEHRWIPPKSLMYWGDVYGVIEDAEKQGEATETG